MTESNIPVLFPGTCTFSGPKLESTAKVNFNVDSHILEHISDYEDNILQMHITSIEPPAEDVNKKIYEDAFREVMSMNTYQDAISSVDKAQLFSESSPFPSNCVLVLRNNKEVHVNKTKEFAEDKERFSFLNIDYDEFLELLSVIYPTAHPITVKNVETLSKLAHEFKMSELLKRCDVFLMAYSAKFGRSKLLPLAQNYNLERLQSSQYFEEVGFLIFSWWEIPEFLLTNSLIMLHQYMLKFQFLSYFSEFFYNMFQSKFKESRESEITLKDVRYEEMVELLSIIYPSDYTITEMNIATIVKLADRFMMPLILERCKKELESSNKIKGALKLWLAQRYNFSDLQVEFARKCNSIGDVKKLKDEPEFELLDDHVRALILESITR